MQPFTCKTFTCLHMQASLHSGPTCIEIDAFLLKSHNNTQDQVLSVVLGQHMKDLSEKTQESQDTIGTILGPDFTYS